MRICITMLILLFFSAGGCANLNQSQEPKNTIHYYHFSLPGDKEVFTELLRLFHLENPEIRVIDHSLPTSSDDQHQFYLTHLGATGKSRIDVFAVDVIWLAEFAHAGLLMPVDDLFSKAEWDEFFPAAVNAAIYEADKYAVPMFVDGGVLYSRKDLLKKYGYGAPPKTWKKLVKMAKEILAGEGNPELQGLVWQGKQYEGLICNFIEFLSDPAPRHRKDAGFTSFIFNKNQVGKTLRFMSDLVYFHHVSSESVFSMSEEESRQVFQNGKAVFMRNWPYAWRLAQLEGSPVAGKIELSPLPAISNGRKGRGTLGGFLLGINSKTPYPLAARTWAKFLASGPAQRILWEKLGLTPARKTIFARLSPRGFPMQVLETVMETTIPRPVTPVYMPLSQAMQAYLSGALVGVYSIDKAIRLIESDSQRIMRILNG